MSARDAHRSLHVARAAGRWQLQFLLAGLSLLLAGPIPARASSGPGQSDAEHIVAALDRSLAEAPPAFCREPGYRLAPQELALCPLATAAQESCPAFAAACERARGADGRYGALPLRETEAAPPGGLPMSWLRALAWPLRVVGLVLLAALGVALLLALRGLLRSTATAQREAEHANGAPPAAPASRVETDQAPPSHLARSRVLASSGDYGRASIELHLAALAHLAARGLIDARPGRTNGEYARALAPQGELLGAFRELSRAVEAVQFGGARLEARDFERLLERAAALLPALLLGLGLLCSVACGGVEGSRAPASAACGTGADGHSLLCTLLEASGARVGRRYRPLGALDDPSDEADVLILLHAPSDEHAPEALEAWVRRGGLLALSVPLPSIDEQLGIERRDEPCGVATVAGDGRTLSTLGPGLRASQLEADVRCSSGDVFIAHGALGDGWVVALPTPAALSNASLAAGDNAAALLGWVSYSDAVVELVGDWTHDAPENPLGQVRAAGLLPWLLQLMLLGACYALHRGTPFARRRAPPERERRRFSEHAQALGQRWAEANASGSALAAYATWVLEQVRERLPASSEQSAAGLAQLIAERTGRPVEAVAHTLERARAVRIGAAPGAGSAGAARPAHTPGSDEAEQLATLRALGRLLEDIGGPH